MPTNPTNHYRSLDPRIEHDKVLLSVRISRDAFDRIDQLAQANNIPVVQQLRNIIEENA
jgi:hypothetical protein